MTFLDLLHNKECWLWCQLRWSEDEDMDVFRIGESQEEAYHRWEAEHYKLLPLNTPPEVWEARKKERELKRGELGIPEWFYYEMEQDGLSSFLNSYNLGYSWDDTFPEMARWGLENGIAPFQPFLLRFPMPYYSKSWTDCGYEYDVDYSWEIMRVLPWPTEKVQKQWERYFNSIYAPKEFGPLSALKEVL